MIEDNANEQQRKEKTITEIYERLRENPDWRMVKLNTINMESDSLGKEKNRRKKETSTKDNGHSDFREGENAILSD